MQGPTCIFWANLTPVSLKPASAEWPWLPGWGEDEGAGTTCATSKITERHNATAQEVHWEIGVPPPAGRAGQ
jgi:hypothetical protein